MKTAKEWQEEYGVPKETAEAIQRDAWEQGMRDGYAFRRVEAKHGPATPPAFPGDKQ